MPQDLYATLELPRGADSSEIRKQYLKLSRTYHPDKVNSSEKDAAEEKFKKISHAYEILSDDSKKSFYDQTGQIPGEGGGPPSGHPFGGHGMPFGGGGIPFDIGNLFGMFGGGMGSMGGMGGSPHGASAQKNRKTGKAPSRKTEIALSLKDFYYGRQLTIHLERNRFCGGCKGEGAVSVKTCGGCNGSGIINQVIQMGPMIINNQGPCGQCTGAGKIKGDACSQCSGNKFIKQDKALELNVNKGMKAGDTITFSGESSHIEEYTEAGDVIVQLIAADEDHGWERMGDTLKIRVGLSLGEALCGKIVKLNGHPGYDTGLYVQIPAGVQNRQEIIVEGCGMPRSSLPGFGDAILILTVMASKEERVILESQKETLKGLFSIDTSEPEGAALIWQAKPITY